MKNLIFCLMVFSVLLLFVGCPQATDPKEITITDLGWYIENIDLSFWSTTPTGSNHAFYDFWIYYSGSDLSASDIEYARVYLPGGSTWWTINPTTFLNNSKKGIGGYGRWWSSSYNTLPIGDLKAEIKLKNGLVRSFIKNIPAPGKTTPNGFTSVYTEDISAPSGGTPLIRRATIGTHSNASGTLSIVFSINDVNVYNGVVWLYDTSNNYVGQSTKAFRSSTDGNLTSIINTLNINGTNNTITLSDSDITYDTGKSFSNISKFIIVLMDGAQYTPARYNASDCISISAKTTF